MRTVFFSTRKYERPYFDAANSAKSHDLAYLESRLSPESAILAKGYEAVCAFVNDDLSRPVLETLAAGGTRLLALRSAGYNHVDLDAAATLGMGVVRVPAYSPYAVAEHTLALILTLNRRTHKAYNRVREGNFSLDGLLGFDLHGKTAGLIGLGKIGCVAARILQGFGCTVLAYDPHPGEEARGLGVPFVELRELFTRSDIVSLHCPLMPSTRHIIDDQAISLMKPGAMLINTSRGGLINTRSVIYGLKTGRIGSLGLDVYEEEADLFFEDLSSTVIQDDVFMRLLTFPNVLVTGHQGFFTQEALRAIADVTLGNISEWERTGTCANQVLKS